MTTSAAYTVQTTEISIARYCQKEKMKEKMVN